MHPHRKTRSTFTVLVFSLIAAIMILEIDAQEAGMIYDVVVYGDSSGAVTAAVAAKRQGFFG